MFQTTLLHGGQIRGVTIISQFSVPLTYLLNIICIRHCRDLDSSVGIATRYGLEGPGIESRWRQDFPHQYKPTLGPTQPPTQWVPGLSRG